MVLLLERSKLVVEGAGAVGVAALLSGRVAPPATGETCVVLSGRERGRHAVCRSASPSARRSPAGEWSCRS